MSNFEEISSNGAKLNSDPKFNKFSAKDPSSEVYNKTSYRVERSQRQSNQRPERDQKFQYENRNKNNNRDRYNPPRYRDGRPLSGNNYNNNNRRGPKPKSTEKIFGNTFSTPSEFSTSARDNRDLGSNMKDNVPVDNPSEKLSITPTADKVVISTDSLKQETKVKPVHGHYHHKNSNKPRFAKVFTENNKDKEMLSKVAKSADITDELQSIHSEITKNTQNILDSNSIAQELEAANGAQIIDQLKSISLDLNKTSESQEEDVFAKLKSGETVELDNLKQLYDKIPDITKTELISTDAAEEWTTSLPTTETTLPDSGRGTCDITCDDTRTFPCCPHGNQCCPPYLPHGFMPPAIPPPHPAYYYAALWNYHHPVPPPAVQRLATAPSLPSTESNGAVHKRFITRSTKTPGSIVFTLHATDNLRIVSVRCDETFVMTADLCNEEGEKVAENFALHSENSPKLWEQYAFSGNHTLHFNIDAPSPTVVVVTFLHEIPLK